MARLFHRHPHLTPIDGLTAFELFVYVQKGITIWHVHRNRDRNREQIIDELADLLKVYPIQERARKIGDLKFRAELNQAEWGECLDAARQIVGMETADHGE